MINLNNAENRLLERHPHIADALNFNEFREISTEMSEAQSRTFQTNMRLAKWLANAEEALTNDIVQEALNDMEISWSKESIMRIFGISKSWYYRLKKAGANDTVANRNRFQKAIEAQIEQGNTTALTVDNFNKVCSEAERLVNASEVNQFSRLPRRLQNDFFENVLSISNDAPTPESIRAEVNTDRQTSINQADHFIVQVKYNDVKFGLKVDSEGFIYEIDRGSYEGSIESLQTLISTRFALRMTNDVIITSV